MSEKEKTWHQDEDFWKTFQPYMFNEERLEEAPEEIEDLLTLVDVKPDAKILDLCCGIGRHSVGLSKRGYEVTGVDATEEYLNRAKERAREENVEVEFVKEDMRKFSRPESFDLVLNLYTSFGYFEEREDDKMVVKNIYEFLKPGGVFVIDIKGKEVLARIFQRKGWQEKDGTYVLEERNITKNWSWMDNRWIMIKDGEAKEFNLGHRIYSAVELSDLLEGVGFSKVEIYGGLDGCDYDQEADRLVAVARKK